MIDRLPAILLLLAAAAPPALGASGVVLLDDGRAWTLADRVPQAATDAAWVRVIDGPDGPRFASRIEPLDGGIAWTIEAGHPAQRGRFRITGAAVAELADDGTVRWQQAADVPVCLPEWFAETAVAADALLRDGARLRCLVPIGKARKLAPLSIRRLPDAADGSRRYEVGPGSLGMRLFFGRQTIEVDADGRAVRAVRGQLEVARALDGRLRYADGEIRYATPRPLGRLPPELDPMRAQAPPQ